jgi:hypothetical protein
MIRKLLLLFAILTAVHQAYGQGTLTQSEVRSTRGPVIPGAQITVCTAVATGSPCFPKATIYTDPALSNISVNPLTADANGNFSFYAPAGTYVISETGTDITAGRTFTVVLACVPNSPGGLGCGSGGGGGGGTPAGPNGTIQSTDGGGVNFTASNLNDNVTIPGALLVNESESIKGPRPHIDVTAYGAKGNGIADDTSAIQSAINASCATTISGSSVHPDVFFPPGIYGYSQPLSTPVISPPSGSALTVPCSGITLVGRGGPSTTFSSGPGPWLIPLNTGASPNSAPAIQIAAPGGALIAGVKIKNLTIVGYNQAVGMFNGTNITLEDDNLYSNVTGQADNTPVFVNGVLWLFWHGGAAGFSTGTISQFKTLYDGEFVGDGGVGLGFTNTDYLIFVQDVTGFGGGFLYDQRLSSGGNVPNNFVFRNVSIEDSANGFMTVTSSGGTGLFTNINALTFDHAQVEDNTNTVATGVLNLNATGVTASGVEIVHSYGGSPAAIVVTAGALEYYHIIACGNFCSFGAQDANGNPLPGGISQTKNGFDYGVAAGSGYDYRLRSDMNAYGSSILGNSFRGSLNGNRFAGVGIDPVLGFMVNDGTDFGFGASVNQSVRGRMDIDFPAIFPPTAVVGTATTGGTLTAATYYGTIYSTTSNCNSTQSAPSIQSSGVVVGGSNNAVTWTWTLPTAGVSTITGYCVAASPTPNLQSSQWQPVQTNYVFVSGASTTNYTMLALPTSGGPDSSISPLVPAHSFTPNALGIGTTSPLVNSLTVAGGFACAKSTKSSAYQLTSGDCWVNVTGTTTITVPHANSQSVWTVNNSGSNTVTLAADSGNMNGGASKTLAANTGATVSCDGTNCFANAGGSGSGTVTTTGSPSSGNLTAFSGANTITNTNLTGDVTTSNTAATTIAAFQGTTIVVTGLAAGQVWSYNGTNWVNAYQGINVDQQTGNYSMASTCPSTDRFGEIEFNISAASTLTIPQAGVTSCFQSNTGFVVRNAASSTAVLTITATTSLFEPEAVSSHTVLPGGGLFIYSDAVSSTGNYHALEVPASFGGVNVQTTNYTLTAADRNKTIIMNCSGACVATLPAAPPNSAWTAFIESIGSTLATVSLNSVNYNGGSTAPTLITKQHIQIRTDGTVYYGDASAGAGGACGSGTFSANTWCGNNTGSTASPTASAIGTQDYSPGTYAAGGGTANAQTVTLSPAPNALVAGLDVCWLPSNANTGATTLNVNGLGLVNLLKSNGSVSVAIAGNDLVTSVPACAQYLATGGWLLSNPQTAVGTGASPPLSSVTGASAQATGTETAAGHNYTFAGVETANLTYPFVIQNTSSSGGTSGALLVNAAGSGANQAGLTVNSVSNSGTNPVFQVYEGGSVSNGVFTASGNTLFSVAGNGNVNVPIGSLTVLGGSITTGAGSQIGSYSGSFTVTTGATNTQVILQAFSGTSGLVLAKSAAAGGVAFQARGLGSQTGDLFQLATSTPTVNGGNGPTGLPFNTVANQVISGADYTNSTTTPSTVFSWTLPATGAAKNYIYTCKIMWESTNTTLVGPVFGVNISAAPTQLTANGVVQSALTGTDTTGYLSNTTTGSQTLVTSSAAGVTSTNYWADIWGTIEASPTAGATFIINAASTSATTATLNIRRGSSCQLTGW